ncbi:MAG: zinc ribbon domain-containing protein [Clostridiales bacterium]|jgi:hypothetical protein|nr:zinc ribbon domain-containing protein [Clostridiales bacterium]
MRDSENMKTRDAGARPKKTVGIVETARLNNTINKLTLELEDLQFELGVAYYEDNKNKAAGPYIELVKKINLLALEIKARNAKVLALKGLISCPTCETVISKNDEFCSKCATAVPDALRVKAVAPCRNCGGDVKSDEPVCGHCGVKMAQPT